MGSLSKRRPFYIVGTVLGLLLLMLGVAPASAQVPQDISFGGRLVDGAGVPLVGPVVLDLWIYDAPVSGTALYGEQHVSVPLDAQGNFSLLLGRGDSVVFGFLPPSADLFSGVDRYVEVRLEAPTIETLAPRVPLSSVPWALIAERANEIVRDPNAPRFEDCGDGTVADHRTGLQWEKKTGTAGADIACETVPGGCPDPHDVNNLYGASYTDTIPPSPNGGSLFWNFLARLNGEFNPQAASGCLGGHCDWRMVKISEVQTIMIGPGSAPGQASTCAAPPCIDPGFAAVAGPTTTEQYTWWYPYRANMLIRGLTASFYDGVSEILITGTQEFGFLPVRVWAVRNGSCR